MKIIDYTVDCTVEYRLQGYLSQAYPQEQLLFFDIETTGFIAKNTTLYLIGVLWFTEGKIHIRQWFNEDGNSEKEILLHFTSMCTQFSHLVHFNGIGFDLPYLKQKAELLDTTFDIVQTMSQIDIYKEIRPFKNVFGLDNMKQVSIEQYLKLNRDDTYSGKDLIHIYQRYVANPTEESEHVLLLHNHDDLLGMTQVSQILNYKHFFENPAIESIRFTEYEGRLIIHFTLENNIPLPRRLSITKNSIYLNVSDSNGLLQVPIINTTLKHYFTDYKNYYYLPLEDTAIHKSIATYVDSDHRVKATKNNCYIRKNDTFIPCNSDNHPDIFKSDADDKKAFRTVESLLNDTFEAQCEYIKKTLPIFL